MPSDFDATFAALRKLFKPYEKRLVIVHDTPDNFYADTDQKAPNGHALYFGGVRRGKVYVSLHLMPVYMHREVRDAIPDSLKKRMQGKSCFNFKSIDAEQLAAVKELLKRAFEQRYWRA